MPTPSAPWTPAPSPQPQPLPPTPSPSTTPAPAPGPARTGTTEVAGASCALLILGTLLAGKRRRDLVASKQAEAPLLPNAHGAAASGDGSAELLGTWHNELEGEEYKGGADCATSELQRAPRPRGNRPFNPATGLATEGAAGGVRPPPGAHRPVASGTNPATGLPLQSDLAQPLLANGIPMQPSVPSAYPFMGGIGHEGDEEDEDGGYTTECARHATPAAAPTTSKSGRRAGFGLRIGFGRMRR